MKRLMCIAIAGISAATFVGGTALERQDRSAGGTALVGMAAVYQSLADAILANKRSEKAVVQGILAVERDIVMAALKRAEGKAPSGAAVDLQVAAQHLGEFATEGGAIIEPIRNRLLQGGHHHHAKDSGPEAIYDRGYVVLKKAHKQTALELAKRCAQMASADSAPKAEITALMNAFKALADASL